MTETARGPILPGPGMLATLAAALVALAIVPARAGSLDLRSQIQWRETDAEFGGLSGIEVLKGGAEIYAVSDRGILFVARVERTGDDDMTGLTLTARAPLLDTKGAVPAPFLENAEGIVVAGDGPDFHVVYEAWPRIWHYDTPGAVPRWMHAWDRFWDLLGNDGMEALALDQQNRLLAISGRAEGDPPGFALWRHEGGTDWRALDPIPARDGYAISGADTGPDGALYLVERRFHWHAGFATRIRRLEMSATGIVSDTLLLDNPRGNLDNSEGISVWRDSAGRIRITLVSDDNFNLLQRTLVTEFVWQP